MLGDWSKKKLLWFKSENVLPCFLLGVLWCHVLDWVFKPFWVYFCSRCEYVCKIHWLPWCWPAFPAPLAEVTVFLHCISLPSLLRITCPKVCGFMSGLCSVLLIYMCVFVPVPYCFDYCAFTVLSEVWEDCYSCFDFCPQDYFGNPGSFEVAYKF